MRIRQENSQRDTLTTTTVISPFRLPSSALGRQLASFSSLGLSFRGALCLHFDILGDLFASLEHPGRSFGQLGGTLEDHEQQDGHEVVRNTILIDFGVILEPVYASFLTSRRLISQFFRACFHNLFLYRFLNRNIISQDSRFEVFA